jgi:histidyl-tRNA synthetase
LFFDQVCNGLARSLHLGFELDRRLVRGLDYYTHTVFEFVTSDLGAQGAVLAGGRYDGLVELMGGPTMAGVGWAAGIERLALMIAEPSPPRRPVAVVPIGERGEGVALVLSETIRSWGLPVELGYSGNLSRRMRGADRARARLAILIGDDELNRGIVKLRDLDDGRQEEIDAPLENILPSDSALGGLRDRLQKFYC